MRSISSFCLRLIIKSLTSDDSKAINDTIINRIRTNGAFLIYSELVLRNHLSEFHRALYSTFGSIFILYQADTNIAGCLLKFNLHSQIPVTFTSTSFSMSSFYARTSAFIIYLNSKPSWTHSITTCVSLNKLIAWAPQFNLMRSPLNAKIELVGEVIVTAFIETTYSFLAEDLTINSQMPWWWGAQL